MASQFCRFVVFCSVRAKVIFECIRFSIHMLNSSRVLFLDYTKWGNVFLEESNAML